MQLCQGFERNGDGSAVATGSRRTEPLQSIWQFLAREEVQALGDIVRSWTRGDVDGFTARRQLQSRVLRDDMIRNMTGHDRGSPHAIRFRPGGREPQNAWSDTVGEGGGLGHRPQLGQPGSLFSDFESGMFARLAGAASGAPWRLAPGEQGHEVFGTIDTIFGARFFEDARSLAMRELGLDGSSPVPDEVRASFREKATSILQALRGGRSGGVRGLHTPSRGPSSGGRLAMQRSWLGKACLAPSAEPLRHLVPPSLDLTPSLERGHERKLRSTSGAGAIVVENRCSRHCAARSPKLPFTAPGGGRGILSHRGGNSEGGGVRPGIDWPGPADGVLRCSMG